MKQVTNVLVLVVMVLVGFWVGWALGIRHVQGSIPPAQVSEARWQVDTARKRHEERLERDSIQFTAYVPKVAQAGARELREYAEQRGNTAQVDVQAVFPTVTLPQDDSTCVVEVPCATERWRRLGDSLNALRWDSVQSVQSVVALSCSLRVQSAIAERDSVHAAERKLPWWTSPVALLSLIVGIGTLLAL